MTDPYTGECWDCYDTPCSCDLPDEFYEWLEATHNIRLGGSSGSD